MRFINKKDKPPISEEEISRQMNFDKFISGYTPPVKRWLSGGAKFYALIASVSVVLIAAAWLAFRGSAGTRDLAGSAPFILPPVKALDIPADTFVMDAGQDTTILFSSGTLITVPSGSFADADGQAVTGSIELHYREFHDPVSIMLSGIPMDYDSAGTRYQLESAGMFEIIATRDGKPLSLMPGKVLSVNMVSLNPNEEEFNFYSLDTVAKKWNYTGENTAAGGTCVKAFEKRVTNDPADAELLKQKPVLPMKAAKDADNFVIDFNQNEFPELLAFIGIKFQPVKGETKYKPSLAEKIWEDVTVERHADGEHYVVTFISGKEKHAFKVTPVVEEKDYAAAMKEFEKRQQAYERLLKDKRRWADMKSDSIQKLNSKFRNMAHIADQDQRFNAFIKDNYTEASQDLLAYRTLSIRTFSVNRLGIYNSDRPFSFFAKNNNKSEDHEASFISEKGQALELMNVILIRRGINSIYPVSPGRFSKFPFRKDAYDIMLGITDDGHVLYLKDDELRESKITGNTIRFNMRSLPAGMTKAEQLKDLLRI